MNTEQNSTAVIKIEETTFNYKSKNSFLAAFTVYPPETYFIVDMSNIQFIESSGIGLLVMLRKYAGGDDSKITLSGCGQHVYDVLHTTYFFDLFIVEKKV